MDSPPKDENRDDMFPELVRPTRPSPAQHQLFDITPSWEDHWWGMPLFEMKDARPQHRITLNFMTADDVYKFARLTGLRVTPSSDSAWFPDQPPLSGKIAFDGPPTDSLYPVCIPSKGRADCHLTPAALDRLGVSYRVFVESTEYDKYAQYLPPEKLVYMPFHDLGHGSIPARNFIWEWAKKNNHARHWVVDDNISSFVRCHNNRRLVVRGGGIFRSMEDFVDRYENIAMAGPHDKGFAADRDPNLSPYLLNSRIYSCILIDTSLPHRWRGRYNEDTDLSLRVLKDGWCTCLFRALLMDKASTYYGTGTSTTALKGGNTDHVYNTNDHRRAFAESLRDQHPDVVSVVWKYGRWHHQVNYSPFKQNRLRFRSDITPIKGNNEYGMKLVRVPERST